MTDDDVEGVGRASSVGVAYGVCRVKYGIYLLCRRVDESRRARRARRRGRDDDARVVDVVVVATRVVVVVATRVDRDASDDARRTLRTTRDGVATTGRAARGRRATRDASGDETFE